MARTPSQSRAKQRKQSARVAHTVGGGKSKGRSAANTALDRYLERVLSMNPDETLRERVAQALALEEAQLKRAG